MRPQAPQLFVSVVRSRQMPEQLVVPATHVTVQVPAEHTWPEAHARPHMPQLLLSVVRSRQTPEQLVVPITHETVHALDAQT